MNLPQSDLPRIVVIGCGFAGIQFVKKINTQHYQVVLIDQNNYHTFQPLLYQVATSGLEPDSIAHPIRKTFRNKKRFHFRLAEVITIKSNEKKVYTSIGEVQYDYCVIATGANSNYFGMKDIQRNAMPMKSLTEALNLRSKILQNFEEALKKSDIKEREKLMNVVIVGAGPTGVELAGAIAELKNKILPKDFPDLDLRNMQIHLIEAADQVLDPMSDKSSQHAEKFLRKMGVNVWLNTMVKNYDGTTVETNKENFITDTLIWSAGVAGSPPESDHLPVQEKTKRIQVDAYGQVKDHENVYALGDVALFEDHNEGKGYPMLGSVAMQQGIYLGKLLNRRAKNKSIQKFVYKDKGTMATIGRNKAVADLAKMHFKGVIAWFIWMFVHLMLLVGFRNRVVVFINWSWNYFKYNNGHRLIVRPYHKDKST